MGKRRKKESLLDSCHRLWRGLAKGDDFRRNDNSSQNSLTLTAQSQNKERAQKPASVPTGRDYGVARRKEMRKYILPTLLVLGFVALLGIAGGIETGCDSSSTPASNAALPKPKDPLESLTGVFVLEGCTKTKGDFRVDYCKYHDLESKATCWTPKYTSQTMFCLPDSQLKHTTLPAEFPAPNSP